MEYTSPCLYADEKMVDIAVFSGGRIAGENAYYVRGIKGSINKCLMRESVAERLLKAAHKLPAGYRFKVWDAWRPYDVQYSLYYDYFGELAHSGKYDSLTVGELHTLTKTFVSLPNKSLEVSYAHSSGGAVDITIVDDKGCDLPMGSAFDEFSERSNTNYYILHPENNVAKANRSILCDVLGEVGFTNLPSEWWHFDYGDVFWADVTNQSVLYKSIYEIPEEYRDKIAIHG